MNVAEHSELLTRLATSLAAGLYACDMRGDATGHEIDRSLDRTGETVMGGGKAIEPSQCLAEQRRGVTTMALPEVDRPSRGGIKIGLVLWLLGAPLLLILFGVVAC